MILTAYVAVKGAYQAAMFEERVEERNLLYIAPLLTIALALFAATRADPRLDARAGRGADRLVDRRRCRSTSPGLEGDAPGLAILSRWHDDYELGARRARTRSSTG